MSWADFETVLAPKTTGTKNLDELFNEGTEDGKKLEFFFVFSSVTSTVGTTGQSAYSNANHYMASLVRQRRARGLAGSLGTIACLTGLSFVFR